VIVRSDQADAELISHVAAGLRAWGESTGESPPSKILREAIWFFWQQPRLERPVVASKYPRTSPWSEEAARLALSGESTKGLLEIEHVEPLNRVSRWLLDEAPSVDTIASELPKRVHSVIVTRAEAKLLPDAGTPAERYLSAGLDLDEFRALDDWRDLVPSPA
jgi:hypothetical protein